MIQNDTEIEDFRPCLPPPSVRTRLLIASDRAIRHPFAVILVSARMGVIHGTSHMLRSSRQQSLSWDST